MGVGDGDGGEEGGAVEGAGVKEVWRFCGLGFGTLAITGRARIDAREPQRVHTSAGFEGVGAEGEDVGGETGLQERGLVRRDSGGGGRSSHRE